MTGVDTTRDIIPLLLPYHHTLPSFTKNERIGWHGDQNFAGKHAMFVFSPLSSSKTGIGLWYGAQKSISPHSMSGVFPPSPFQKWYPVQLMFRKHDTE
jgi:hypothetical protein